MSTHNIQFHDKIRKKSLNIFFLSYPKNYVRTEQRVRIMNGKRAIRVRAIEVILYFHLTGFTDYHKTRARIAVIIIKTTK